MLGANELGAPVAITGGGAQDLIATAFGLGIAITLTEHGDTKAELGNAVAVLDEVRKAGISKVAVETKPKQ